MKKELSALDIAYLVKEFQVLIDAKIDGIYQPRENDTILSFFIPSKGKKLMRILPNFIYFTNEKANAENPTGFCMTLRKFLINSRIRAIKQVDSERIIEFLLETKEAKYRLNVELFSKGNIILCKEDYEIINLLEQQMWKDRELKPHFKYKIPSQKIDFFKLDEKSLKKILESDKILVKKLAIDIGLGGIYSEEVCLLADIDKNKIKLSGTELNKILDSIEKIVNRKIEPCVVYKNGQIFDITPFKLDIYKNLDIQDFKDYNSAIEFVMSQNLNILVESEKTAAYEKKIKQLEQTIEKQQEKLREVEDSIQENEKKAELIYSNYNVVKDVLETIKKASSKYSWDEIKSRLKGHKTVKEINSKDKKVVLEL